MVYLLSGQVLLDGSGHVAFDPACCCGGGVPCHTGPVGRCAICKFCLGPENTCDCGSGAYTCGYDCIDNLTELECNVFACEGYSTSWTEGALCAGATPCDLFVAGCAHTGTTETGLGMCCDDACDCVSGITQADCFSFGGTCWHLDCACFADGGIGCGICNDSCGTGACCTAGAGCVLTTYSVCNGLGGFYQGDNTTCPDIHCDGCICL